MVDLVVLPDLLDLKTSVNLTDIFIQSADNTKQILYAITHCTWVIPHYCSPFWTNTFLEFELMTNKLKRMYEPNQNISIVVAQQNTTIKKAF